MSTKNKIENNSHFKDNPFQVPENYFDKTKARLATIPEQKDAKVLKLEQKSNYRMWLAAAAVALLVATTWTFWPETTPVSNVEESIGTEDLIALNEYGYLPFEEYDILETLNEADIDAMIFEDDITDYYELTQPTLIEQYYLLTEEI